MRVPQHVLVQKPAKFEVTEYKTEISLERRIAHRGTIPREFRTAYFLHQFYLVKRLSIGGEFVWSDSHAAFSPRPLATLRIQMWVTNF